MRRSTSVMMMPRMWKKTGRRSRRHTKTQLKRFWGSSPGQANHESVLKAGLKSMRGEN